MGACDVDDFGVVTAVGTLAVAGCGVMLGCVVEAADDDDEEGVGDRTDALGCVRKAMSELSRSLWPGKIVYGGASALICAMC